MTARRATLATAALLLAATFTGCAGEPEPVETTPGFATEAEAFAAAEETYRAYVDALNQVDLADPETFEAVYAWTTGDLNAQERENLSRMHADGWKVGGETVVVDVVGVSAGADYVVIDACVDVSNVTLVDAEGESQVSPSRPALQSVTAQVAPAGDGSFQVSSSSGSEVARCSE